MTWCLSLAEQEPYLELFGTAYRGWLTRIDAEYGNLRLALEWAIDHDEAEIAQRLIFPLCRFWFLRGYLSEGRALAERALTLSGETPIRVRALAMAACGFLAWAYGEIDDADHLLAEATGLLRPLNETVSIAIVLYVSALVAQAQDEHERAQRFLEEALPLFRDASETTPFVPHVLGQLGSVVYRQHGNIDRAEMHFVEALEQFRQLENAYGVGTTLTSLGRIARDRGDYGRAATLFAESLNLHWDDGDKVRIAGCLNGLAIVAALSRQPERAARLFAAAEALREAIGAPVPRHLGQYARALGMSRQALGEHAFGEAWAAGRALPLIDAVREAAALSPAPGHGANAQTILAESYGLTARELEVLRLLPRGLTNREIGDRLFITERTAATHVQNIFGKLDIGSRSEAAAFAVERGLA
jgi:ATP/maltotriose-dependent transcriptional regulator MalT